MKNNLKGSSRPHSSKSPLPARPNLEHLKKQAKSRLKTMRLFRPETKLADAQTDVARAYGFASWRKLKAHLDALDDEKQRLLEAVRTGQLEVIAAVLDCFPELANGDTDLERRLRPSDGRAMRLIHLAVAESQVEAARLLIDRGADLNARNADGRLPIRGDRLGSIRYQPKNWALLVLGTIEHPVRAALRGRPAVQTRTSNRTLSILKRPRPAFLLHDHMTCGMIYVGIAQERYGGFEIGPVARDLGHNGPPDT